MRRMLGLAALSLSVALLAACGDEDPDEAGSAPVEFEIPVGDPAYDVHAPTWAVGTSIHVGDVEITADPAPEVYVVTRSGIYYVAKRGALYFTDGGPAQKVAELDEHSLAVSADQQHLALIDRAHGSTDPYNSFVAVPVVFDLDTGEQVFRARPGREPDDDDLPVLYGEIPPRILGVDGEAVYAVDPLQETDETRFPLDGSAPEPIKGNPMVVTETGIVGFASRLPRGRWEWSPTYPHGTGRVVYTATLSPSGEAMFTYTDDGRYFDAKTGEATVFGAVPFALGGWIDDDTFYGAFSKGGSVEGPAGSTVIAACTVGPQPECSRVTEEFQLSNDPPFVFGTGSRLLS